MFKIKRYFKDLALIAVVSLVLMAMFGCTPPETNYVYSTDDTLRTWVRIGNGIYINEFSLSDGTKCVAHSSGGISCNW